MRRRRFDPRFEPIPTRRGRLAALFALLVALAEPAQAIPFTATFSVHFGKQAPIVAAGAGDAEIETSSGGATTRLAIPAGIVALATTFAPPVSIPPIVDLRLDAANGALLLSAGAAPCDGPSPLVGCEGIAILHGRGGLSGVLRVGLFGRFGAPATTMPISLAPIGGAGTAFGSNTAVGATARLYGAGFTTGRVTAIQTFQGNVIGSTTAHGSVMSGPGGIRTIQLVTPVAFRSSLVEGGVALTGIGRLSLNFVPEPTTALLLGAGVGALALRGRRRRAERAR